MKTSRSTRLARYVLLSALVLASPLSPMAQQAETGQAETGPTETGQTEPAAEPQDEQTTTDANGDAEGDTESGEVFIPSEEISEDFAVSFPVDI